MLHSPRITLTCGVPPCLSSAANQLISFSMSEKEVVADGSMFAKLICFLSKAVENLSLDLSAHGAETSGTCKDSVNDPPAKGPLKRQLKKRPLRSRLVVLDPECVEAVLIPTQRERGKSQFLPRPDYPQKSHTHFPFPCLALGDESSVEAGPILLTQHVPKQTTAMIADQHTQKSTSPFSTIIRAWKAILDVSSWILKIIEQGYLLQFARRPSHFREFSRGLWSDVSCFLCDSSGPASHAAHPILAQSPCTIPRLAPGTFSSQGNPSLHQNYGPLENLLPVYIRHPFSRMVITNTYNSVWGALCKGRLAFGSWSNLEQNLHIKYLKMMPVFLALKTFLLALKGHHVLVCLDNMMVVAFINRQGGFRSRSLHSLAQRLLLGQGCPNSVLKRPVSCRI
ncbi:GBF-interacting protein 1-like [Labeo rohita]|uniref:GBF-interacting protein 1-like n=1 Tax=Labeo rohita TaxID=84645 RepID=A0ABQ8LMY9_LABRO|nr:GBF-interacting protein 1-like [Labeo rohita]